MAYDEALAERVRAALASRADVAERRMFGGLCFLVGGRMVCGVTGRELMLRLGEPGSAQALERADVRPMDFTGRPLRGFVFVREEGVARAAAVRRWVDAAVSFATAAPPKRAPKPKAKPKRAAPRTRVKSSPAK